MNIGDVVVVIGSEAKQRVGIVDETYDERIFPICKVIVSRNGMYIPITNNGLHRLIEGSKFNSHEEKWDYIDTMNVLLPKPFHP